MLLYTNADDDATKLYRLDPWTGAQLSVETLTNTTYSGLGFDMAPFNPGVEPDDYAESTVLNNIIPEITLSVVGSSGDG